MKTTAMEEIANYLYLSGLTEEDVNHLLARFLEEEAEDYVECMKLVSNNKANEKYEA